MARFEDARSLAAWARARPNGRAKPEAAAVQAQHDAEALMRPYLERTALKLPA